MQAVVVADETHRAVSVAQTFVVQLFVGSTRVAGRVEHVVSGQSDTFESAEELVRFFKAFSTLSSAAGSEHE